MLFAVQDNNNMVAGILIGICIIGFIWMIVAAAQMNLDPKHEIYAGGIRYETAKAHRIVGQMGERVTGNGQWVAWCKSLWRTFPWHDKKNYFFILHIDELTPVKLKPVTAEVAKKFIQMHTDEETATKLIREWIDPNYSIPTNTTHHQNH